MEANTETEKKSVVERALQSIYELNNAFDINLEESGVTLSEFKETLSEYLVELAVDYEKSTQDTNRFFNWFLERLAEDIINDSIFADSDKNFDLMAGLLKQNLLGDTTLIWIHNNVLDNLTEDIKNKWEYHDKL